MNYDKPELLDSLAGQYVLGTLRGLARKRFQRLLLTSNKAREATSMWEQNLNNLASAITPKIPNDEVWVQIMQRIENKPQSSKTVVHTKPSIWRTWSFVATAACIILAFLVIQPTTSVKQTEQIALVQNQDKQSLWFIDVNAQGLAIKASSQLVAQTNKDYELWMILKGQDTPISLGLLPKQGDKLLLKDKRFKASDIALLAVSLEPIGGSPNGLPTEVLYTTELVLL
ncbi:anti-sigma factor [Pseudoalteromonas carrageenovora]|uniref:anti-sigma factor n=1 Tax=Pseudoalteromonas carrageenovora TaxID=227 RepID=UPI0026E1AE9B|nr:anti-sigma factor [Pseudoalteromonas carrageenovora]MDO6462918.1 anti-sigma factor [Pseudoalteromonas carrageenovora]MDO6547219.1 anti-sigma factor [Pseudoalteromonas carrageenovora]MDO6635406.1 anti-sigma factor [Pseudoalteromonas carrageenovora]MDO6647487.1 anti-sigma factor [Pseudoalteromonas carrageenovora]MDO6831667.1 anti-sigma factor [Pseudoalteromonas carrageenovora]